MLQIYPIAHLVGEFRPFVGVHHDVLTTGFIVVVHADFLTDILFGDTQTLLNAQFYREAVGVPSGFTLHLEALHGFVAQEGILDGTSHHVVNTWVSVC